MNSFNVWPHCPQACNEKHHHHTCLHKYNYCFRTTETTETTESSQKNNSTVRKKDGHQRGGIMTIERMKERRQKG